MDIILRALKNEISAILALAPADNLHWCGSHTDLFEAAALVCTSFPLYTSAGQLYRVGPLIHELCLRLHLDEPHIRGPISTKPSTESMFGRCLSNSVMRSVCNRCRTLCLP